MTNLGVRHESEGMGLGSRGYKELNLHLPGCARRGSGQRGQLLGKAHVCHGPGSSWKGVPEADGWLCAAMLPCLPTFPRGPLHVKLGDVLGLTSSPGRAQQM